MYCESMEAVLATDSDDNGTTIPDCPGIGDYDPNQTGLATADCVGIGDDYYGIGEFGAGGGVVD